MKKICKNCKYAHTFTDDDLTKLKVTSPNKLCICHVSKKIASNFVRICTYPNIEMYNSTNCKIVPCNSICNNYNR